MDFISIKSSGKSENAVFIDVDSICISEDNNNNNNNNNEGDHFKQVNKFYQQPENVSYKCKPKYLSNNQKTKSNAIVQLHEKRHRYAKSSPRHKNIKNDNDSNEKEQFQLQPKSSKCSAHFESDEDDNHRKSGSDRSSSRELHPRRFVPRKSLLGKPIMNRNSARQDAQYRKLQSKIYNFLERPKNCQAVGYHILVFASVFTCLILSVLSTIETIGQGAGEMLFYVELTVLFWFFTEYCLRMWSAGCRSRYQTWRGRLLFAKQPFCLVDLVVILASIIVLALGSDRQMFAASALRGLRFFQILRMIRMDRRGGSWKLLASVVWAHRQELFTTIYIGFLVLVFSSFLIYLAEKDEKENINSYADALWWGVITLCTVGYGDTVPKTALGKLIAGCCAIFGISFFALPAGILGSGFALKVQQHQRHKHLIRRRMPAANLIQCLWRCYSSDPQSTSIATWKPHMKSCRPSTVEKNGSEKISKYSRLSTIKRRCEKLTNLNPTTNVNLERRGLTHSLSSSTIALNTYNRNNITVENETFDDDAEDEDCVAFNQITTPVYPISRRNALAQSVDKSKEDEILNKKKFGILDDFFLNRYTSMASMTRDETEDWETFVPKRELTNAEKNAIRFLRKVRYFVASRKFKEALRPYDLKDIIEQYSSGHVDMLARIKGLQFRLDNLFGRNDKNNETYDSRISLASRIIKIESKVENIELKLDKFIQLYRQNNIIQPIHHTQRQFNSGHPHEISPEIVPHPSSPLIYRPLNSHDITDRHKPFSSNSPRPTHRHQLFSTNLDTIADLSFTSANESDTISKKFDEV